MPQADPSHRIIPPANVTNGIDKTTGVIDPVLIGLTLNPSQKEYIRLDHVILQKVSLCRIKQAIDTAPRHCFNIQMVLRRNRYLIQWQNMPFCLHSMFTLTDSDLIKALWMPDILVAAQ